jgi:hypothetical protein
VPLGTYTITAVQSGYVPSEASLTVIEGVPVTIQNFTLQATIPFTVAGSVTGTTASPIAGATVTLVKNAPVPGILKATTDASGHYSLTMDPGPYVGDYTITASASGFMSSSVTTTIPNGATFTEHFALQALGAITGLVADTTATPIIGATVTTDSGSTTTNSTGHYTLAMVAPGVHDVTVVASGFNGTDTNVTVTPGATASQDFTLVKASGVITGTVVSGLDGTTPFRGATVSAAVVGIRTTTDVDGKYTLSNVPAGQIEVTATAKRCTSDHRTVQVNDNQTVEVDFQLEPIKPGRGPIV